MIKQWLANMFPRWRIAPTEDDVKKMQTLQRQVFDTPQGRELLEHWLENIVLANPRTTDPNECIAFTAKCAFVEDVIKATDRARDPQKYEEDSVLSPSYDPRLLTKAR